MLMIVTWLQGTTSRRHSSELPPSSFNLPSGYVSQWWNLVCRSGRPMIIIFSNQRVRHRTKIRVEKSDQCRILVNDNHRRSTTLARCCGFVRGMQQLTVAAGLYAVDWLAEPPESHNIFRMPGHPLASNGMQCRKLTVEVNAASPPKPSTTVYALIILLFSNA